VTEQYWFSPTMTSDHMPSKGLAPDERATATVDATTNRPAATINTLTNVSFSSAYKLLFCRSPIYSLTGAANLGRQDVRATGKCGAFPRQPRSAMKRALMPGAAKVFVSKGFIDVEDQSRQLL
jgi:hypothetical protein